MKTHTHNSVFKGELEPEFNDERIAPLRDNGIPGPGTYVPDDHRIIQVIKIK